MEVSAIAGHALILQVLFGVLKLVDQHGINRDPVSSVVLTTGKYMFTQPDGNSPINSTSITTPWFDLTALDTPAVYFKSHLYGAAIQSLSVEIDFGNGWTSASGPNTLISLAPTQQKNSPWQQNIVNLLQYQNDTVRFRITGTRNAQLAKIAVDDFCIDEAPFLPSCGSIFLRLWKFPFPWIRGF